MGDTTIATANVAEQWDAKAFLEYTRDLQFKPYMGTSENSAIQVKENLIKMPGDGITISLIGRLKNSNVGTGTLEGNEESLGNFGHKVEIAVIRNAFVIDDFEQQKTPIDIRNAGKTQLKNWSMDLLRDEILEALHSRQGVAYGSTAAGDHDTWNDDNDDRLIYVGTTTAGNHGTQLLTLTGGTDTLSATVVSLARRKARTADPHIKPIRVNGQEEWFIMFCDPYAMRDLRADTTIQSAQRDALARGQNNPLFRAGDIIWDGVICREVPEIATFIDNATGSWGAGSTSDSLKTAGAANVRVGVSFLLGAQAAGVVWGQRLKSTTDTREYGFVKGFGVQEFRGTEKLLYQTRSGKTNACDHGVVTVYTASAVD